MKTFVHFDARGVIHGIVGIDAPDGVMGMVEPEAGLLVTEIENPKVRPGASGEREVEKLRDILRSHKINLSSGRRSTLEKSD